MEQPGHRGCLITKLVICVAPFSINPVLPGFQCINVAVKIFFLGSKPENLRLDPIPGAGSDNLIASGSCSPQLSSDNRPLATADQDFVLYEALKLADDFLEVLLLTFLDLSLIDEYGFVDRIVERLRLHGNVEFPTIARLQPQEFGCQRRIDRRAADDRRGDEALNRRR